MKLRPPHSRHRRRWAAALLLLATGGVAFASCTREEPAMAGLQFTPVTRGPIEEAVTAQGSLKAEDSVDIGAQVTGQLLKLHVEPGDDVKKGQLIAQIDPKIYKATVEASEAQLKSLTAQRAEQTAQVDYTRSVYERNRKLMKGDAISRQALDESLQNYKASQARVTSLSAQMEQTQSRLNADRVNLGFTSIYAPRDGSVISQTAKEGQTLNANQTTPVIVTVANLDKLTVSAQVAEADVARLKPGMPVYFTTLGSERKWQSTLRQLLPSPDTTVLDVVLYNALVDIDNSDRGLMIGMSTQMFFVIGSEADALQIPVRALGKKLGRDEKGDRYEVQVKSRSGVERREVVIGLMNRTMAQVVSGLSEGDEVASISTGTVTEAARRGPRI